MLTNINKTYPKLTYYHCTLQQTKLNSQNSTLSLQYTVEKGIVQLLHNKNKYIIIHTMNTHLREVRVKLFT